MEVDDGDEMDAGKSAEELAAEKQEMAKEEEDFARYRSNWESTWGSQGYGYFEDTSEYLSTHDCILT